MDSVWLHFETDILTAGSNYFEIVVISDPAATNDPVGLKVDLNVVRPRQLAFLAQPGDVAPPDNVFPAGFRIYPPVQVEVLDDNGNRDTAYGGRIGLRLPNPAPCGGTLSGGDPVTPVDGVATFENLIIDTICDGYTLVAYAENDDLAEATSDPFNITRPGDLDLDGCVDQDDLDTLNAHWGDTSYPPADINKDGTVDVQDLGILLSNWTALNATTDSASGITDTRALLFGTANPNGVATNAWFEWSTDPQLEGFNTTPAQSIGSGTDDVTVSAELTELSPSTTYYFRLVATHSDGCIARGEIESFTTGWSFEASGPVEGSPAIAEDGTIYLTAVGGLLGDGNLYALNPDGSEKWSSPYPVGGKSSPALANDGTVVLGGEDGHLYILNANGTQKCRYALDAIPSSPALGEDGTMYVGTQNNSLYAITPACSLIWKRGWPTIVGGFESSPGIGRDGTIYIASWGDGNVYAINPDGSDKWIFNTGNSTYSSPSIGEDETIYVGAAETLYALDATSGTTKWTFGTFGRVNSSPSLSADGHIYVADKDGFVYALDLTGQEQWRWQVPSGQIRSSPSVGDDGVIYISSTLREIFALSLSGDLLWSVPTASNSFGEVQSSAAVGDKVIYVGSGRFMYAIAASSTGLAASSWPRFRHDNLNTGRAR